MRFGLVPLLRGELIPNTTLPIPDVYQAVVARLDGQRPGIWRQLAARKLIFALKTETGVECGYRDHVPNAFPPDQNLDPDFASLRLLTYPESGAVDGNRTHTGVALGA